MAAPTSVAEPPKNPLPMESRPHRVEGGHRWPPRAMSQKGGERAYKSHLGKDRNLGEIRHSAASRKTLHRPKETFPCPKRAPHCAWENGIEPAWTRQRPRSWQRNAPWSLLGAMSAVAQA